MPSIRAPCSGAELTAWTRDVVGNRVAERKVIAGSANCRAGDDPPPVRESDRDRERPGGAGADAWNVVIRFLPLVRFYLSIGSSAVMAALAMACSDGLHQSETCADPCGGTTDCYAICMCESESTDDCQTKCPVRSDDPRLDSPAALDAPTIADLNMVMDLMNTQRADGGCCATECLAPSSSLQEDAELARAAQLHADDMAARGYFDHVTPEGLTPFDRMRAAGFRGCAMAENLGEAYDTPEELVVAWLASPEHCRTLLDDDLDRAGLGRAIDRGGAVLWVANFGLVAK